MPPLLRLLQICLYLGIITAPGSQHIVHTVQSKVLLSQIAPTYRGARIVRATMSSRLQNTWGEKKLETGKGKIDFTLTHTCLVYKRGALPPIPIMTAAFAMTALQQRIYFGKFSYSCFCRNMRALKPANSLVRRYFHCSLRGCEWCFDGNPVL